MRPSAQPFGLVAEDVAKVAPDLVVTGADGKPYTVRYDEVNAMLLNEFLKEHQQVAGQQAEIAAQQKKMDAMEAQLVRLEAKVGDRN